MTFPNLAGIIAEETNGDYTFEHIDKGGYSTLYLKKLGKVIMYDQVNRPIKDVYESNMNQLSGDVLICGLGCGFAIFPIKDLSSVNSITVIENDATIIAMMQPFLPGVTFIEADAKSYNPSETFDSIFLDIWDTDNNLEKYGETMRYRKFLRPGGYINYLDFEDYYRISSNHSSGEYEILSDVIEGLNDKNVLGINYKTELKSNIRYTPVFTLFYSGLNAGLLDKTEYYRGYVDANNKGQLVITVEEVYTIDDSDLSLPFSAMPALERNKTWKHTKKSDNLPEEDTSKQKNKTKKYDTRKKRHKEGNRRRENIQEQLIDHVGLGGVLCGAFSDEDDAFNKLTQLQTDHSAAFNSWSNSGRGPIYDDITANVTTWLDTVVPDNGTTQAMIPWMIGMDLRTYIVDKLKGNVK